MVEQTLDPTEGRTVVSSRSNASAPSQQFTPTDAWRPAHQPLLHRRVGRLPGHCPRPLWNFSVGWVGDHGDGGNVAFVRLSQRRPRDAAQRFEYDGNGQCPKPICSYNPLDTF
jgi:hypothetical protein